MTESFASKFKSARVAAGHTQKSVSELLQIPIRTVQDWEGERRTPPEYVQRLILRELDSRK